MTQGMQSLISFWLKKNYRNICNYLDQRLEQYDLTNSQLSVLLTLWEQEGLTQKRVGQILGIQPASLTFLLRGLEKKEFIRREQDQQDTRANRLYATSKSLLLKEDCLRIMEEGEQLLRQSFLDEEMALFRCWLERMEQNFNKY
ncbi:MarR family winged helix-turn-helix transcriptional regulator [Paenibacillus sp. 481]|uniref:MarR family winged helix-turn-helix transcriptional regulator n=1 Tax=Paenibacillus sp. 481 TaxID=2835869 RepID=UPI001E4E54A5|nr:MarR family transcriptional regulator [Paenibacillus sp. 481]UHA72389.1 MarR family transcriptional regulator [Paenibacillus sp. 481]